MDLVKKLAVGATTIAIALTSVTPAFAAKAYNKDISGGSIAKAKAVEKTTYNVGVLNVDTTTVGVNVVVANSGLNFQKSGKNSDGTKLVSGDAQAKGTGSQVVNQTVLNF